MPEPTPPSPPIPPAPTNPFRAPQPGRPSRRQFIASAGFAALSMGLLAQRRGAAASMLFGGPPHPPGGPFPHPHPHHPNCVDTGARPLWATHPIFDLSPPATTFDVDGVAFADRWYGDPWSYADIPFHSAQNLYPGGEPPEPSEEVDIAIVGGGLSGLATAYLLRRHKPVVFELHDRFGGTSIGEFWRGNSYSLGGAYFITPDEGSFLEHLYRRLGLNGEVRVSPATDDPFELNGAIAANFWDDPALTPDERLAFQQYRDLVNYYVENYPDIPLDESADNQWILDLDSITLRQHILSTLTVPVPPTLQAAIQGYCYSSFDAGWDEISAASGWNFIAAEEYGRWVLPGGNAGLIRALWDRLVPLEAHTPPRCPPRYLRAGVRVVEVKKLGPERIRVVWKDANNAYRTLIAKRVVMSIPKHIARHVLTDLQTVDPSRYGDFANIQTAGYVVANVRLRAPIDLSFYDMFLLHNGVFPDPQGVEAFSRITDVVKGDFSRRARHRTSVLTCYWPLPYPTGRFELIADDSLARFAPRSLPEIDSVLSIVGRTRADIESVRLARWGHAMPLARPNMIASGACQRLRAPWQDHIFFVAADNWALPAVETCLLEAEAMRPLIEAGL